MIPASYPENATIYDRQELARNAPGMAIKDDAPMNDIEAMRRYRLERLQAEIRAADCDAAVLFAPINWRYATGTRFAQISSMHFHFCAVVVPPEGGVTVYGWGEAGWHPETVAEVRPFSVFNYFPPASMAPVG